MSWKKEVSLDLEITRSSSVSPHVAPVEGEHDFMRGPALNDELLAGQHSGPQTQRNNNRLHVRGECSIETGVRSNDDHI